MLKINFFDYQALSWKEKGIIGFILFKYNIGKKIDLLELRTNILESVKNDHFPIEEITDDEIDGVIDGLLMYGFIYEYDKEDSFYKKGKRIARIRMK